jgi:hypothetical protein
MTELGAEKTEEIVTESWSLVACMVQRMLLFFTVIVLVGAIGAIVVQVMRRQTPDGAGRVSTVTHRI